MLAQQAQNPFLVYGLLLHEAQVGPHATIPPKRMDGLERLDALQEVLVALGHGGRALALYPSNSSPFFNSSVSSPTRVFSRVFSRARRASR